MAKARTWLGGDELKGRDDEGRRYRFCPNVRFCVVISRFAGRCKSRARQFYPLARRMLAPMATWTNAGGSHFASVCEAERHRLENIT